MSQMMWESGSGGKAPCILNSSPFITGETAPSTHWIVG